MTHPALLSLNSEWDRLVAGTTARVQEWARSHPELSGATDLDAILRRIGQNADPVLHRLIDLGADDRLAWRVVLQAMLGKVVLLSRGDEERFSEAVSEMWLVIAEYPLQRRRSVAANLAWMLHRRLAPRQEGALPRVVAEPSAAATLISAHDLGLVGDDELRTLWLVYIEGLSSSCAGDELGISAALVRYRCHRSLRRLSSQVDLLAA